MFRSNSKDWFEQKLLPTVERDLNAFVEQKNIDYTDVVATFKNHLGLIVEHYQEAKQPLGVIPDYITAMDIGVEISPWDLLKAAKHYLYQKIIQGKHRPEFSGEVKVAIDIAKQNVVPESDGHKRLLQVSCKSERDLMRLSLRYLDFFYLKKEYKYSFSHTVINLGLNLPGVSTIVYSKIDKVNQRIKKLDDESTEEHNEEKAIKLSI